jgi:dipeptidyl aminopeptidase/acylaminoacyl peptidase
VLSALTFHDTFHAGASHYGIGELESAMAETHKFESRYGDELIGPWPEARAIYRERSPLHHAERLDCPVIFFQGMEDKVVPPNQAERMVEVLHAKGVPVAYLTFAGESHGFRRGETIRRVLEAEFSFYATLFEFAPAENLPPLTIENINDGMS